MKYQSESRNLRQQASKSAVNFINIFLQMALIACFIAGGYWLYLKFTNPDLYPFHYIHIKADANHISSQELSRIVSQNVNGGFFSLRLDNLRDEFLKESWIESVSIRKIWPDRLLISLNERIPIARWNNQLLIDSEAHSFASSAADSTDPLPLLIGPEDQIKNVVEQYQYFSQTLAGLHLTIRQLLLSPSLSWRIILSNGVQIILGRDDIHDRFVRFVQLFPSIANNKADQIVSVNLCYQNALAVEWKK